MNLQARSIGKLDCLLGTLIASGNLDDRARVPVIVRMSGPDMLERVESLVVQLDGSIRHILRPVNAVSAWISMGSLIPLTEHSEVLSVELVETTEVASC